MTAPHDPTLNIIEQRLPPRNLRLIEVICR